MIGPKLLICGQELGFLTVVDFNKFSIESEGKVGDKEERSHINSITKIAAKGLYVIGTNKGLALVKINDNKIKIEKQYYKERQIKSVAFLSGTKVVFTFEGEDTLNIFDLGKNSIVNTLPCQIKGEKTSILLPLSEIIRHDIVDDDTEKRKGVNIRAFKSKLMFLQSDKALSLVNFEESKTYYILANSFGYCGINVDYDQKKSKF